MTGLWRNKPPKSLKKGKGRGGGEDPKKKNKTPLNVSKSDALKKKINKSAKSTSQSSGNVGVRGSVRTRARSGDVSGLCEVWRAAAAGAGVGFQSPKPPARFPI